MVIAGDAETGINRNAISSFAKHVQGTDLVHGEVLFH